MMQTVRPANSVSGVVLLPGDKSISHRYALLAAIAEGTSRFDHFASSRDCHSTLDCLRALGVEITEHEAAVVIHGRGLRGLRAPERILDAGNSGTTIRLLAGILAGQPFEAVLGGDDSLSRRPMGRIIRPLRMMGADIEAQKGELPPLKIRGGRLRSIRYRLPEASAQVKSCILLAGLYADGPTAVEETIATRDHTEIALREFGCEVRKTGDWIEVEPEPKLKARHISVPGDLSGAAFFLAAVALLPNSDLLLPGVGINHRRRELLDYLREAGLEIAIENESQQAGESRADLRVRFSPALVEGRLPPICGARTAALIDEIPVLTILGSQTAGGVEISDAGELRVKESDRISALVRNLRAMGALVEEKPDGLIVAGRQTLRGADIVTERDHRIAMAFGVAALIARGETKIHEAECAEISFPGFWQALERVCRR